MKEACFLIRKFFSSVASIRQCAAIYSLNRRPTFPYSVHVPCRKVGLHISVRCLSTQNEDKLKWSYTSGISDKPLLGATVGQMLQTQAERFPEREAFVFTQSGIRKTFSALLEEADKMAAGLLALGLKPGNRLGIWAPNSAEWLVTLFAAARAGMVLVTINSALKARELEYVLNKVQCRALVASSRVGDKDNYEILSQLIPDLAAATPGNINSKTLPDLETIVLTGTEKRLGTFPFNDVMDFGGSTGRTDVQDLQSKIQFDDPAYIVFTSGTTGQPKAATLSHHNIVNNSYFNGLRLNFHQTHIRNCLCVPLHHSAGLNLGGVMIASQATTAVFPPQPFTAQAILQAIQDEKCTSITTVPTLFTDLVNHTGLHNYNLSSLDTGLIGGSPIPYEVLKRVTKDMHLKHLSPVYGSTELAPIVTQALMEDSTELRATSVGTVVNHCEVKLVDNNGDVVSVGEPGEICVRGYSVFLGYWNDKDSTDKVLKNRWYHTGDTGVLNEDGYLQIVGRMSDMIIRGGVNIYPREIEEVMYQHPNIHAVEVVGIPHERLGEEVCLFVILKESFEAREDEIKDYCLQNMSKHKVPSIVLFVESFPLSPLGKPVKRTLREMAIKTLKL